MRSGVIPGGHTVSPPVIEVEGSHVIMISQPQTVTDHILKAVRAVADSHR